MIVRIAARLRADSDKQFCIAARNADIARILNVAGYPEEAEQFSQVSDDARRNGLRLSRIAYTLEKISK